MPLAREYTHNYQRVGARYIADTNVSPAVVGEKFGVEQGDAG